MSLRPRDEVRVWREEGKVPIPIPIHSRKVLSTLYCSLFLSSSINYDCGEENTTRKYPKSI
jgi:hypothetical protein